MRWSFRWISPSPLRGVGIDQPCKDAFDEPAARQNMKALGGIGALDDLDAPIAHAGQRVAQFPIGISSIGKDMTQPWEAAADRRQHVDGAVTILDIGGMDEDEDQKAASVGDDMALASLHLLAGIIAIGPPLPVVFTL